MERDIKCWKSKREKALILDINQGKTNVVDASRVYNLAHPEINYWEEKGKGGMQTAFNAWSLIYFNRAKLRHHFSQDEHMIEVAVTVVNNISASVL